LLKENVTIVNTSRAALIDEDELDMFLAKNPSAKAIFDVFWEEPYDGQLFGLPNFIATPHIASSSKAFYRGLYKDLLNLLEY
jgi:phosphoglycerate dehydrogenase-like enzyme